MQAVPFDESAISAYASKTAWDACAPELVDAMLRRWGLTAGPAFEGGVAASVLRVIDEEGHAAVLKVGYPHFEAIWEAVGLVALGSDYAPTVLRQDASAWALLLEELVPGTTLAASGLPAHEALDIALELYARASALPAPQGMLRLEDALENYRQGAEAIVTSQSALLRSERVFDIIEGSFAESQELLATTPRISLLHGDLNPGNILRSSDGADIVAGHPKHSTATAASPAQGRWFFIDPKPMLGDAAFDLAPLLSQIGDPTRHPHSAENLWEHTLMAAARLDIEAGRIARWARFRSALNVAWYLEDGAEPETVRSITELRDWDRVVSYAEGTRSA